MPKNTLYILVHCEAMLLYSSVPTGFPSSQLHCCTLLFCIPVTLPWTPVKLLPPLASSWLCSLVTLMAISGLPHPTIAPCQYSMPPTSRQCSPVGIEVYQYCPVPVRLAIHMHRCTHKHKQHIHVYGQLTQPQNEPGNCHPSCLAWCFVLPNSNIHNVFYGNLVYLLWFLRILVLYTWVCLFVVVGVGQ